MEELDRRLLLGAAGLSASPSALDRAYEESAAYLGRIWAAHRDVPAEDHVRAILTAVDQTLSLQFNTRSGQSQTAEITLTDC